MNLFDLGPSLHGLLSPLHWYHAPTQIYPKPSLFKFWSLFSRRFLNIPIAVGSHFSGYLSVRSIVVIFTYRLRSTLWASQSFKRTVIFGWPRIVTVYIATHPRLTLRSSSCISTGGNIDSYIRVFVSALSAHSNHIYFIDARTIIRSPVGLSCTFLVRRQTSCDFCWLITTYSCKNKSLSAVLAAGFEGP